MPPKKPVKTKEWNTSIDDIEKNIKEIRKNIMDTLAHPRYPVTYPDLDAHSYGYITEELSPHDFIRVYNRMSQSGLYSVQAEMAIGVINERFRLPKDIQHQLNLLTKEINRFKKLVEDSKIKEMLSAMQKELSKKAKT